MKTEMSAGQRRKGRLNSFTLVELLVVMAIIAILAALTLGAIVGVRTAAARSRAKSEIQAFATALEGYKTDNGTYPISDGTLLLTNTYSASDGTMQAYQTNAQILYSSLTGQTNFTDTTLYTKSYISLKRSQVGDATGGSYVKDPWGYAYGYSTGTQYGAGTPIPPYNGSGSYDVWSTGGLLKAQVNTNAWISNWQ